MFMDAFCEVPITSATALDAAFASGKKYAIQKYRQMIRHFLDPGMKVSIGHAGTLQLTSIPALACLATAGRWSVNDAKHLASTYKEAGLKDLLKSKRYQQSLKLIEKAVQQSIRGSGKPVSKSNVPLVITQCVMTLSITEPIVREVGVLMGEISAKVDERLQQMKRLPGRLVRVEGPNALVVINSGDREELRFVDAAYLRSFGIYEKGTPFVVHQLSWSPDSTTAIYFPALDLEAKSEKLSDLETQLKNAETPLPEPPGKAVNAEL
jgi:hypothetical protein